MSKPAIVIATRGSELALAQANLVLAACQARFPELIFAISIVKTTGDKLQSAALADSNLPKGLFTKELETALLEGQAHLAVHSLKDLPTELPAELVLGAVTRREDVSDVLIYRDARHSPQQGRAFRVLNSLRDLPLGASVGTSSTRRAAQALHLRDDLRIAPIRGNVPTRLAKLAAQSDLDGLVLAAAGLNRLGYRIAPDGSLTEGPFKSPAGLAATRLLNEMLPCVGQGAIAIEIRADDAFAAAVCAVLNCVETERCVRAERALLRALGGGCQLPLGAYARQDRDQLLLEAISFLGPTPRRAQASGDPANPEALGRKVAALLNVNPQ